MKALYSEGEVGVRIVVVSQSAFMFDICCACFLLDFQASQQSYLAVVRVRMIPQCGFRVCESSCSKSASHFPAAHSSAIHSYQ